MPKRCRHRLCPDWLKRENVTKSCILAQFLQKINVFFSRNPPFPKIVTFPLEQKGCNYYDLAQYKIVTTAPYVNFCSLTRWCRSVQAWTFFALFYKNEDVPLN